MRSLPPSRQNSTDYLARSANRLVESISPLDDWLRTNPNWISCTRNWKASSLTISSTPTGAHMRSLLTSVVRKPFVPRTVNPRKHHAPSSDQEGWTSLRDRKSVVVGKECRAGTAEYT